MALAAPYRIDAELLRRGGLATVAQAAHLDQPRGARASPP